MAGRVSKNLSALVLLVLGSNCSTVPPPATTPPAVANQTTLANQNPAVRQVLASARDQIKTVRGYTQAYYTIPYPGGDVPSETGACTDVVIRSLRSAGVDLQREVHEDMAANFSSYPRKWGLTSTDTNIDHRRVPNLQTFFKRKNKSQPLTIDAKNYLPGDIVTWDLNGKGMTHVGIVSDSWNRDTGRYRIIHNIGGGTNEEDRLFDWKITGHFRYFQ